MASAIYENIKASGVLPSPAGVALKLWHLTRDPHVGMNDVVSLIESDPAVAARVLKFANSAFVGASQRIGDLHRAVMLLGTRTVTNLSLGLSLIHQTTRGPCKQFDYEGFWSESTVRATTARRLACDPINPNDAYTCGLLGQIGRLALATAFPEEYGEILAFHNSNRMGRLFELERKKFGIDHNQLTAEMMADWRLPESFPAAVLAQDGPLKSGLEPGSEAEILARLLFMGGRMAPLFESIAVRREHLVNLLAAAHRMDIPRDDVPNIFDSIGREWQESSDLLPVRTHPVPSWQQLYAGSGGRLAAVAAAGPAPAPAAVGHQARWFMGD